MTEIRWHGRGGAGAVTAAALLATAAFKDGKYAQSFGAFGPERRGAPVRAFTRISDKPIKIRQQIYEPDIIIIMDPSLIKADNAFEGMKKQSIVLINSETTPALKADIVYHVNATKIATEILGKPIVNTAILGAIVKATDIVSLKSVKEAVKERFEGDIQAKNLEAIERAYKECYKCQLVGETVNKK